MVRNVRKIPAKIKKQIMQSARILDKEKDTIYWLVFVPKTSISSEKEFDIWKDPWRIRLPANPKGYVELIDRAIRSFESNNKVKTWNEIAIRHFVDKLYCP